MKTVYCLGGTPQFRLACFKYSSLIKERQNKFKKNIFNKMNEKEFLSREINPFFLIKRCLQINPNIKKRMNKFYKSLGESLTSKNNDNSTNNNYNKFKDNTEILKSFNIEYSNDGNNIKNLKYSLDKSNFKKNNISKEDSSKYISILSKKSLNEIFKNKIIHSRNKSNNITQTNLSTILYNYNYPLSKDSGSFDLFQSLIYENKAKKKIKEHLLLRNDNKNILNKNSFNRIIYSKNFISSHSNKKKHSKKILKDKKVLNKTYQNIKPIKLSLSNNNKKIKNSNLFNEIRTMYKNKRKIKRDILSQHNELNLIYAENEKQFYKKYERHRKRRFLNGLALTHLNCSPKVILDNLNKKIDVIKNKVAVVKYISDKAFPRVLADITFANKKYEKRKWKKEYFTPHNEELNKIKKQQKEMDSYFSIPFKVINRNIKNIEKN